MPRLARLATAVTAAALSTAFLAPASLSAPAPHSATAQRAAIAANPSGKSIEPVSYTHLTLPTKA